MEIKVPGCRGGGDFTGAHVTTLRRAAHGLRRGLHSWRRFAADVERLPDKPWVSGLNLWR